MSGKTMLIVPDAHAHPDYDNRRFTALGNFIASRKFDHVVCLGDWFDYPSLSHYDKGKKSSEGRRIDLDTEVGIDAFERAWAPSRKQKKQPFKLFLEGNHEFRYDRRLNDQAELDGALSKKDLLLEEYWDEVVAYKDEYTLEGITFSHAFTAGNFDKEIGGVNAARTMIVEHKKTVIQGHSHLYSYARDKEIVGLQAGCFFEAEQKMTYMGTSGNARYWRGLTVLNDVRDGDFDIEQINLKRLLREFL